ncbi:hypothetical protein METBIDRAFT_25918, partial [Metschnikowia bicuspidata var. bicuspidata NRRL YB-4993]
SVTDLRNSLASNVAFSVRPLRKSTKSPASEIDSTGVTSLITFSNANISSPFFFSVLYASRSSGYFSSYFTNFFNFARTTGG